LLIVDGRNGTQIKKEKHSEKENSKIPAKEANHATEGAETLIQFISRKYRNASSESSIAVG
jgi:hypothetical protein